MGEIDSFRIWNVSVDWRLPSYPVTLFATAKSIADDAFIVDRTLCIHSAAPRRVQDGFEVRF